MNNELLTSNQSVYYVVKAGNQQVSQLFENKITAETIMAGLDARLFNEGVRVVAVDSLGREVLFG